jgi:hypothetical protein
MNDMLHYRKAMENIIEKARFEGLEIKLEKNALGNVDIMITDNHTNEKCRVRKVESIFLGGS